MQVTLNFQHQDGDCRERAENVNCTVKTDPQALDAAIENALTAGLRELTTDAKASGTKFRTRTGCVRVNRPTN